MADTAMPAGTPAQQLNERFTIIYTTYRDRIARYLVTRVHRDDLRLVDDLASETFVQAWRSLPQLRGQDNDKLFRWLRTIACRVVADHYRVMRNTREVPADTGHWTYTNRALVPAAGGTLKPVNAHTGDSGPDPDELLRRARESKPRALAGAK
jgi:DNA-directed RNA polymerase specialized sigma24 family protein